MNCRARQFYEAAIAIVLLSAVVLGRPAPSAGEPAAIPACGGKRIGEITVATLNRMPIVTLLANKVPVVLLLDTGAQRTILTPAVAERIGAQPPRVEFDRRMRGIARTMDTREVELHSFTIGGVAIPWRRIAVVAATLPSVFSGPLDGVLGADVLSAFDVDVDLAQDRIVLHEPQSCPEAAPDWSAPYVTISTGLSAGEHLFFPVQLDGRRVYAIVDTGAQMTALSTRTARALGVSETTLAQEKVMTIRGSAGEQLSGHIHRFARLDVSGEALHNPEIIVADLTLSDADLVLGVDFIRSRRVWFSYRSRQIFLSRAHR
jgi:predicted aspartyl protease